MDYPTKDEIVRAKEDEELRQSIVERMLGLVYQWAWHYYRKNPYLDLRDLVSEGVRGLYRAIQFFDPQKGEFTTIASFHIRSWMLRFIRRERKWWGMQSIHWENEVGRNTEDRVEMYNLFGDNEEYLYEEAKKYIPHLNITERQKKILSLKLEGYSYANIAQQLGLTRERVRQLFNKALEKIQEGGDNNGKNKNAKHLERSI